MAVLDKYKGSIIGVFFAHGDGSADVLILEDHDEEGIVVGHTEREHGDGPFEGLTLNTKGSVFFPWHEIRALVLTMTDSVDDSQHHDRTL